jgi:hypothetical protein
MTPLIRAFVDIVMLRRDPGSLPASGALLAAAAVAFIGLVATQAWLLHGGDRLPKRVGLEFVYVVSFIWALLMATRRNHRFVQTLTAVLGTSVLLGPITIMLLVLHLMAASGGPFALLVGLLNLGFSAWVVLILANILRSSLDAHILAGVVLAILMVVAEYVLLRSAFPRLD